MKKIKCIICGKQVAPGARKYCMNCQADQIVLSRKKARDKFYKRLDLLPEIDQK